MHERGQAGAHQVLQGTLPFPIRCACVLSQNERRKVLMMLVLPQLRMQLLQLLRVRMLPGASKLRAFLSLDLADLVFGCGDVFE